MPDATLKHVPGMQQAAPVPEFTLGQMPESRFLTEFVSQSRPCIIRGAARHWPALHKWHDRNYLKQRSGHHQVNLFPHEYFLSVTRNDVGRKTVTFAEALDHLQAPETDCAMIATAVVTELAPDVNGFHFLSRVDPAFTYPLLRHFLYRNAGTTWHYHPFDETLMCQVIGPKKIGLLQVTAQSRMAVRDIFLQENYYDDPAAFERPGLSDLAWFSASLEAGDALYIPQLWWHGVIPVTPDFGITTAVCWRSPLPVLAESIRKMASGEVEMIGMGAAVEEFQQIFAVAQRMGLENELVAAWKRGI